MRRRSSPHLLVLAIWTVFSSVALANWTASGRALYRDRLWNETGFTGVEPLTPARFVDIEVKDASSGTVLAQGATGDDGRFSISVTDSSTPDVYVRFLSRSTQTPGLFLKATDAGLTPYAVASTTRTGHNPDTNVDFGDIIAGIGAGGEAFNLYDMGVLCRRRGRR